MQAKISNMSNGCNSTICRICLGDENTKDNPLISPCKCDGTMGHIHIECLREWLNSKRSFKENTAVKTYCWKALECELCKVKFPDRIVSDGGKYIELISFDKPYSDYLVLESVT
jgi:E3 ubiquitin-protein ligase DOA10